MHLETITATATAPGASGAAAAAVTGDSLTIKSYRTGTMAGIVAAWADVQGAGFVQIASPAGHDTTRGYRVATPVGEIRKLVPDGLFLPVMGGETLSVTIAGSATAGDVEQVQMLVLYEDLPGISAQFIDWAQLMKSAERLTTIHASITSSAGPGYSGAELITAESDLLRANRRYAVIGMTANADACGVGFYGPDTGNMRICVPGESAQQDAGASFFGTLSRMFGWPLIPVINAGNKGSTYLFANVDENAGTIPVTMHLALLREK